MNPRFHRLLPVLALLAIPEVHAQRPEDKPLPPAPAVTASFAFNFTPGAPGKFLADLPGLARRRLAALGVMSVHGNDGSATWCTVLQPSGFFSHRRDAARLGSTGRLAACIWLA